MRRLVLGAIFAIGTAVPAAAQTAQPVIVEKPVFRLPEGPAVPVLLFFVALFALTPTD